jgi:hypothetical protein
MIGGHKPTQMCTPLLKILLLDIAELVKLCYEIATVIRNYNIERIELCIERIAYAA